MKALFIKDFDIVCYRNLHSLKKGNT